MPTVSKLRKYTRQASLLWFVGVPTYRVILCHGLAQDGLDIVKFIIFVIL